MRPTRTRTLTLFKSQMSTLAEEISTVHTVKSVTIKEERGIYMSHRSTATTQESILWIKYP